MNFDTYMDVERNYPIDEPPVRQANQRLAPKLQMTIHKPKHRITKQLLTNKPTPEQIAAHIIALQILVEE